MPRKVAIEYRADLYRLGVEGVNDFVHSKIQREQDLLDAGLRPGHARKVFAHVREVRGRGEGNARLAATTAADSAAEKAAAEKKANDQAASDAGVDPDSMYMAALSGAAADPRALAALIKQQSEQHYD